MGDDRLIETFLDLVRIDSPSGSEAAVAQYCAQRLRAMGCDVWFDDSSSRTGANTGNLFARLDGEGSSRIVLSAHMDCVQPCIRVEPLLVDHVITSAGETVLGADDKAGIAAILESVERVAEGAGMYPGILIVLTVSEEPGLLGAKAVDLDLLQADICLVLDADGAAGGIVTGAPTHYTFEASFMGMAAHAGVAPEQGTSALLMAARSITDMRLGRLDEMTTANIGSIESGTATNVVPAHAVMTGECRSRDDGRARRLRDEMDALMRDAAAAEGGSVEIVWTRQYTGFDFPDDHPAVLLVADACRDVGVVPRLFKTGGGSDGNIFSAAGVPTLVLSCGMQSVHSVDERLDVRDLHALVDIITSVMNRLAV